MRTRGFLARLVLASVPETHGQIVALAFSLLSPIATVKNRVDDGLRNKAGNHRPSGWFLRSSYSRITSLCSFSS